MKNCKHKWKIIEDKIISYYKFFKGQEYWHIYTLQCSICGELKHSRHSLGDMYKEVRNKK